MITKILGLLSEWALLPLLKDLISQYVKAQKEKKQVKKENETIDKVIEEKYDDFKKRRSSDDFDQLP